MSEHQEEFLLDAAYWISKHAKNRKEFLPLVRRGRVTLPVAHPCYAPTAQVYRMPT